MIDLNRTIETEHSELGRYLVARGGIEPPFAGRRGRRSLNAYSKTFAHWIRRLAAKTRQPVTCHPGG